MITQKSGENPISKEAAKQKDALKDLNYLLDQIIEIDNNTLALMEQVEYFKYNSTSAKSDVINRFIEMYDTYYIIFNTKDNRYEIMEGDRFDYKFMSFAVQSPVVLNKYRKNSFTELNMKFLLDEISENEFRELLTQKLRTYLKKEVNTNYLAVLEENKKWEKPVVPSNSKDQKIPMTNYLEAMKAGYRILDNSIGFSFVWRKQTDDQEVLTIVKKYARRFHVYSMLSRALKVEENLRNLNSEEKFYFLKKLLEDLDFASEPFRESLSFILEIFTRVQNNFRRNSTIEHGYKDSFIQILSFIKKEHEDEIESLESFLSMILRKNDLSFSLQSYVMEQFFPNKKLIIRMDSSDTLEITDDILLRKNLIFAYAGFVDIRNLNHEKALLLAQNKMLISDEFGFSSYRRGSQLFLLKQRAISDAIKENNMIIKSKTNSQLKEVLKDTFSEEEFMFA